MFYFFLVLIEFTYITAIYFLVVQLLNIYHFKYQKIFTIGVVVIFCIPVFCMVDYLFRGIPIITFFATIGYVLAGFIIYFILTIIALFIVKWLYQKIRKKKSMLYDSKMLFISIFSSIVICIVGIICAQSPNATHLTYDIGLEKDLKVVAMSDLHYGSTGSMLSMEKMIQNINDQNADLVFLVGDVFDNQVKNLDHDKFVSYINQIKSNYGVYAVTGNHEFICNSLEEIIAFYKGTQVHLLLDEEVTILNEMRLIGRVDYRIKNRKKLDEITTSSSLPLLVLDHQPQSYKEAYHSNAFLQISGHTHNGQIFPGNIFLKLFNRLEYDSPSNGIHSYDNFTLGITRGYGTWGFPYRLTGTSHYYIIDLK